MFSVAVWTELSSVSEDGGAAEGGKQNVSSEKEAERAKSKAALPTMHLYIIALVVGNSRIIVKALMLILQAHILN